MADKREQREHERSGCDIEARIELSDRLALACRIKNLSPSGFRLQISEAIHLPDEFDLLVPVIPGTDQRCRVRQVWRLGRKLGGEFITPFAQ